MASPDAYTAPFMLTKSMHRDVYPAIDPAHNKDLRADSKVIIIFGATSGLGFVGSYLHPSTKYFLLKICLHRPSPNHGALPAQQESS